MSLMSFSMNVALSCSAWNLHLERFVPTIYLLLPGPMLWTSILYLTPWCSRVHSKCQPWCGMGLYMYLCWQNTFLVFVSFLPKGPKELIRFAPVSSINREKVAFCLLVEWMIVWHLFYSTYPFILSYIPGSSKSVEAFLKSWISIRRDLEDVPQSN